MGQFSNSFPKHFSYLCEYAFICDLSCSFCEYPIIFHCLHCSPSCFDPDSLLLAYFWLGLSWIDLDLLYFNKQKLFISKNKQQDTLQQQQGAGEAKHSAENTINFSEEVDLESTSEPTSPVGKPVLHMQPMHTSEPVAQSPDALARPASNNMPLSEHDTQELRRLLCLKAEGIERQERLQYLRQTWKSSIWSEEDDDSYTLPDPEIPLVYSLHYGQQCPPEWDDGSVPAETADRQKKKEHGKSNLHAEEDFLQKIESLNLEPRLKKLLLTYEEVFGALPPPLSCKKLVQMDLKLKPEFEKTRVRRCPYPAPQEQVEEIERQIGACSDAGLVEEYKKGDYPHHCSPCFLVAKPGSTALQLAVDYGEVNKKTHNHSGSIPNMENTLERIAKCRYKTKMDKRSGFWQVDLTAAAGF